ncbi:MAG: DUF58 domain-containing protein [Rhodobacteraceae bacterium]|uniref:Putatative DUF58 protein n=1 Tax=Salipiger profundus TaxID=1229727 RepID=A0A1U7D3X4_9RHOB|nr:MULTISPECIES: DUF58 domain-containing protein [Salipiger]APX22849.1 putatative DUF58 protein [Salipiger profundus]MAB05749.1 DUF58 domain-containing protein [Paracoccaceae bacterium]GGA09194.1 hypothetical protein GCM10011326_21160 [Salipiger profundus]SFC58709.1 Protein of unknown function DUF58 [Salipiger profundus]
MSERVTLLRRDAQEEAARFPALLARAEHLAGTVLLGEHGRRRAGMGDDFWQYRPLRAGDSVRSIDWRRSARGDEQFVREREWQIAQSVQLWVDGGASMRFSSDKDLPSKGDRARLIGLATAILLIRGGERVGFTGWSLPPRNGDVQILRLSEALSEDATEEYSEPEARGIIPHARALFVSDFLGDIDPVEAALTKAADRGVRGVLLQVLDPTEESFPFKGRTIFQSMGGGIAHETLKAGELRDRYLDRLNERKDRLDCLSRLTGWQYMCHHTSDSAQSALLWVYRAMDGGPG